MKITKREVMASIVIFAIMLLLGFIISDKISDAIEEDNSVYTKALRVDTKEMFEYGMKTNIGNAFVYGALKSIDTVSYPEIKGEYMYLEKEKEKYTRHTRTVRKKVGTSYKTTIEEYWTWDRIGTEQKHSKEISFLGIKFPYKKIKIPSTKYIKTIKESSKIRYKYYGCKTEYTGTIFTELKDNTISDKSQFYQDKNIKKTLESCLIKDWEIAIFWIIWIVVSGGLICGFCYLENNWLED